MLSLPVQFLVVISCSEIASNRMLRNEIIIPPKVQVAYMSIHDADRSVVTMPINVCIFSRPYNCLFFIFDHPKQKKQCHHNFVSNIWGPVIMSPAFWAYKMRKKKITLNNIHWYLRKSIELWSIDVYWLYRNSSDCFSWIW